MTVSLGEGGEGGGKGKRGGRDGWVGIDELMRMGNEVGLGWVGLRAFLIVCIASHSASVYSIAHGFACEDSLLLD